MKVPRYTSKGSAPKAQARSTTADTKSLGANMIQHGKQMDAIGQGIIEKDRALKAKMAEMTMAKSKIDGDNVFSSGIAEAKLKLGDKYDEDSVNLAISEMAKAKTDGASMIKPGVEQDRWSAQREGDFINASYAVRHEAYNREGTAYGQALNNVKFETVENSVNNPDSYTTNMKVLKERLSDGVSKGFVSQAEEDKHLREAESQIKKRSLALFIKKNPESVLESLKDENDPFYSGLTEEERNTAKIDANNALESNNNDRERVVLETQNATFNYYMGLIKSGQASSLLPSEIDEQVDAKLIDADRAEVIKTGIINDPNAPGVTDAEVTEMRILREKAMSRWSWSGYRKGDDFDDDKAKYYALLTERKARGGMTKAQFNTEVEQFTQDTFEVDSVRQKAIPHMSNIIAQAVNVRAWNYQQAANAVYDEVYANPNKKWGDADYQEALSRHLPGYKNKLIIAEKAAVDKASEPILGANGQDWTTEYLGDETNG